MENDSDTCEGKILRWLEKHGYPLEMEVAAAFRNAGFNTTQGDNYKDLVGKLKEIDICANYAIKAKNAWFSLSVLVECKLAASHPWVAFTHSSTEMLTESLIPRPMSKNATRLLAQLRLKKEFLKLNLFKLPHRITYSMSQAISKETKETKEDLTFIAINSAQSAAKNMLEQIEEVASSEPTFLGCYTVPLVVTGNNIYECFLNSENRIEIEQTNHVVYHKQNLLADSSIVDIVTKDGLSSFIESLLETANYLEQSCQRELLMLKVPLPKIPQ